MNLARETKITEQWFKLTNHLLIEKIKHLGKRVQNDNHEPELKCPISDKQILIKT